MGKKIFEKALSIITPYLMQRHDPPLSPPPSPEGFSTYRERKALVLGRISGLFPVLLALFVCLNSKVACLFCLVTCFQFMSCLLQESAFKCWWTWMTTIALKLSDIKGTLSPLVNFPTDQISPIRSKVYKKKKKHLLHLSCFVQWQFFTSELL